MAKRTCEYVKTSSPFKLNIVFLESVIFSIRIFNPVKYFLQRCTYSSTAHQHKYRDQIMRQTSVVKINLKHPWPFQAHICNAERRQHGY